MAAPDPPGKKGHADAPLGGAWLRRALVAVALLLGGAVALLVYGTPLGQLATGEGDGGRTAREPLPSPMDPPQASPTPRPCLSPTGVGGCEPRPSLDEFVPARFDGPLDWADEYQQQAKIAVAHRPINRTAPRPPTHRDAPKLARRPPGVSGVVVWVVVVAVAVHPTHMEMHARESAAPAGWQ